MNRKLLKENAKVALKHNFWMIMLIALVGTALGANWNGLQAGRGNSVSSGYNFGSNMSSDMGSDIGESLSGDLGRNFSGQALTSGIMMKKYLKVLADTINKYSNGNFDYDYDDALSDEANLEAFGEKLKEEIEAHAEDIVRVICFLVAFILILCLIAWVIGVTFSFLIGSFLNAPIGVGYRRFFMRNRKREAKFGDLFATFRSGVYMKTVKTMFATNIKIWAWSLLFYFPGMVKSYQYYFVGYIMAENPNISPERAREISTKMSDGHKWDIFVLELSFIGWGFVYVIEYIVLVLFSCGLLAIPGLLLIYPLIGYQMTTFAELYAERREYALMTGIARADELIGF